MNILQQILIDAGYEPEEGPNGDIMVDIGPSFFGFMSDFIFSASVLVRNSSDLPILSEKIRDGKPLKDKPGYVNLVVFPEQRFSKVK